MKPLVYCILDTKTFVGNVIKFFTRSSFAHTAIWDYENDVWIEPSGKFNHWRFNSEYLATYKPSAYLEVYALNVEKKYYHYAMRFYRYLAEINCPYNWLGVIGFVLPFFTSNGGYFCSEGCWEGLRFAKYVPSLIPGWKFSPDEFRDFLLTQRADELYSGSFLRFKKTKDNILEKIRKQ